MSLFRKILEEGVIRRDRKRNLDIMKAVDIDKDITDLIRISRLTYCGHVTRISAENFYVLHYIWTH